MLGIVVAVAEGVATAVTEDMTVVGLQFKAEQIGKHTRTHTHTHSQRYCLCTVMMMMMMMMMKNLVKTTLPMILGIVYFDLHFSQHPSLCHL